MPIGVPSVLTRLLPGVCRLAVKRNPNLTIPFTAPKAKGFHADVDNEFYETITVRAPHFFDLKINSLVQILECMTGKDSAIQRPIECPILVFKTLYDRYFKAEYFDRYFAALVCPKKLVEINDVHNNYFLNP